VSLKALRENWLGFLTAGLVGGLVLGVFTVIGTMSRLETRQNEMSERLNRIAAALPDVGVRVAQEEIKRPLDGAVVVAPPVKTAKGDWVSPVHVISTATKQRDTYLVPADGPDDRTAAFLASGIVVASDPSAITMRQASGHASLTKDPAPLPAWVQADSSYIIFKNADHLKTTLHATISKKYPAAVTKVDAVRMDVVNFKTLSEDLTKNAVVYTAGEM
jgi:hypothetical protein